MAYIDEATARAKVLVKALDSDPKIPSSTKEALNDYVDFMKAKGLNDRTINKNLYSLSVFIKAVGKKDILKKDGKGVWQSCFTKNDVMAAMAVVEATQYSLRTKQDIRISVKAMYKHFVGQDEFYPEQVRWIKGSFKNSKRLLPEDILTEEDVFKVLEYAKTDRDKALIAMLFDSGIRLGELLGMKIKDVDLESSPAHIVVNGKTGMRKIPLMFSVPYVGRYLDACKKKRKSADYLWERYGKWAAAGLCLDRSGVAKILKDTALRARIEKPINPHAWRHARATYYANRLTEQQLKQFFGWTGGSQMASVYVHLSGRDLDNGVLQANGYKVQELQRPKLQSKVCPRCRTANGTDMMYCGRCGSALSIEIAMAQDKLNETYAEMSRNPDILKLISKEQRKKKAQEKRAAKFVIKD